MSDQTPSVEELLNQATILPFELPPMPDAPLGFVKLTPISELAGIYVKCSKIHSILVKPGDLPLIASSGATIAKPVVMLMIESPEINKVLNVVIEESVEYVINAINEARASDFSN